MGARHSYQPNNPPARFQPRFLLVVGLEIVVLLPPPSPSPSLSLFPPSFLFPSGHTPLSSPHTLGCWSGRKPPELSRTSIRKALPPQKECPRHAPPEEVHSIVERWLGFVALALINIPLYSHSTIIQSLPLTPTQPYVLSPGRRRPVWTRHCTPEWGP